MKIQKLNFFTEYYQFYILDAETKASTDAPDFWCSTAEPRRLAIGEGLLGVTVAKYAKIKVDVKILNTEPAIEDNANHVVETSLAIPSGILQIKDCTAYDTILEVNLEKTSHQIRISSFNLGAVKNDVGKDYYKVEIWKAMPKQTLILKEWKP